MTLTWILSPGRIYCPGSRRHGFGISSREGNLQADNGEHRERNAAILSALGATVSYGVTPVFLRHFTAWLDPWMVNGIRYSIAAIFWLPVVLSMRRSWGGNGASPDIWRAAMPPAVINATGQVLWGLCPYFLTAPVIGFASRLSFLFTVLIGFALVPRERLLARQPTFLAGALVCIVGMLLMFRDQLAAPGASGAGVVIMILTNVMFGAYAVSVGRHLGGFPTRLSFGVVSLYTAPPLLLLMFLLGDLSSAACLDTILWGQIAASALIGIALAHVFYFRSIHGLGPVVSTGLLMAIPFVTHVTASLFLKERMTSLQLAGGLILVAGGVLLVIARSRADTSAMEDLPA